MITAEVPGVYCDTNIGRFAADLEFDQSLAQEIMRNRGMSDAAISELTFNFAYHNPVQTNPKGADIVTMGLYDHPSRLVNTYLEHSYVTGTRVVDQALSDVVKEFADEKGVGPEELLDGPFGLLMDVEKMRMVNNIVNRQANSIVMHEIDHAVELNTEAEGEVAKKRHAYREKLWTARQNKIGGLLLVAFASLAAPVAEEYERVPQSIVSKTLIPELLVAAGSVIVANIMQRRRPYDPLTHEEYLRSPWEVEAQKFSAEALGEYMAPLTLVNFRYELLVSHKNSA